MPFPFFFMVGVVLDYLLVHPLFLEKKQKKEKKKKKYELLEVKKVIFQPVHFCHGCSVTPLSHPNDMYYSNLSIF